MAKPRAAVLIEAKARIRLSTATVKDEAQSGGSRWTSTMVARGHAVM
jgi:hypothetical protein